MTRMLMAFAVIVCVWLCGLAFGDSVYFPPEVHRKTFDFGKSKIEVERDGKEKEKQFYPPHALFIYLDGLLMAQYKNVGFTDIHPSHDNRYFVGLSNTGITPSAFVVFDADGNLLREVKHEHMPERIYTARSPTVFRWWFDREKPDVQFEVVRGRLSGVRVTGSNGQRYDLLAPDLGFVPGDGGGDKRAQP